MKGCCTQCKKLMKGFIAKMSEIFRGGHHYFAPQEFIIPKSKINNAIALQANLSRVLLINLNDLPSTHGKILSFV